MSTTTGLMQVTFLTIRGGRYVIDVNVKDTIKEVKQKLANALLESEPIAANLQRILFRGRECMDDNTVEQCSITKGSILHVVARSNVLAPTYGNYPRNVNNVEIQRHINNNPYPPVLTFSHGQQHTALLFPPSGQHQTLLFNNHNGTNVQPQVKKLWRSYIFVICLIIIFSCIAASSVHSGFAHIQSKDSNFTYSFGYVTVDIKNLNTGNIERHPLSYISRDLENGGNWFGAAVNICWILCLVSGIIFFNLLKDNFREPRRNHNLGLLIVLLAWGLVMIGTSRFAGSISSFQEKNETRLEQAESKYAFSMMSVTFFLFLSISISSCIQCCQGPACYIPMILVREQSSNNESQQSPPHHLSNNAQPYHI